jgi:hypothetical protein
MPERTYTLDEIRDLWERYNSERVVRIMKDGKWQIVSPKSIQGGLISATRAEHTIRRLAQSFPEFLEGC